MLLKICGITIEKDIEILNEFLPDYAGFVFAKSKRQINMDRAKELIKILDPRIKSVGVFVNEELQQLVNIAKVCNLHAVQLHGDEDEDYINKINSFANVKIIKCVCTKDEESVLSAIKTNADYILFDTYSDKERGGTGKNADLSLISKVKDKLEKPFILAGGINASNVPMMCTLLPYALDVSSGVEAGTGGKDYNLVKELFTVLGRI